MTRLITSTDLEHWADSREAEGVLPELMQRLVFASGAAITQFRMPAGDAIWMQGWDGIVETTDPHPLIPDGKSAWEFGRDRRIKSKADEDYSKRCRDTLGVNPTRTAFVFVTPRTWRKKTDWGKEKRADRIWKDVVVLDGVDLEVWLADSPGVGAWLAAKIHGVQATHGLSDFWEEWSSFTDPHSLPVELLVAGRSEDAARLSAWLDGKPAAVSVRGELRDEAIAFLYASQIVTGRDRARDVQSRAMVVDSPQDWRTLIASQRPLILIPRFEGEISPAVATRKGHHVYLPAGSENPPCDGQITLPRLEREGFVSAFQAIGWTLDDARTLARRSGRSVRVLRRRLAEGNPSAVQPAWRSAATARILIGPLLAGQWVEEKNLDPQHVAEMTEKGLAAFVRWPRSDKILIGRLAEMDHDVMLPVMTGLLTQPDPPLIRIGDGWRLTSHEDAWYLLAAFLTPRDLERFEAVALELLSNRAPSLELPPDERWAAAVHNKTLPFSGTLRKGVTRTLALMAARDIRGTEHLNLPVVAERIVHRLMEGRSDWRLWATLGSDLIWLAEAAPEEVLDAMESTLQATPATFLELFQQEGHGFSSNSHHTGLLWALETLAWSESYFQRAALILARLATLDPGGRIANRPVKSLTEIFRSWMRYTSVSDQSRLDALSAILDRYPEIGWSTLISVLPSRLGFSTPTHRPEWRDWAQGLDGGTTVGDMQSYMRGLAALVARYVGTDPARWSEIVPCLKRFDHLRAHLLLSALEGYAASMRGSADGEALWAKLRDHISYHRSFRDSDWSDTSATLDQLERIYHALEPDDVLTRYAWVFGHSPALLSGERRDHRQSDRLVREIGKLAIREVLLTRPERLVALIQRVEQPSRLAMSFFECCGGRRFFRDTVLQHLGSATPNLREFSRSATGALFQERGWKAINSLIANTRKREMSDQALAEIYLACGSGPEIWARVAREAPTVDALYCIGGKRDRTGSPGGCPPEPC